MTDPLKFDPARKSDAALAFGFGQHQCFGRHLAGIYLSSTIKLAAKLKNLRPAPGEMGVVKTIRVGNEKAYLNDSWSYLAFDASSKSPPLTRPTLEVPYPTNPTCV